MTSLTTKIFVIIITIPECCGRSWPRRSGAQTTIPAHQLFWVISAARAYLKEFATRWFAPAMVYVTALAF